MLKISLEEYNDVQQFLLINIIGLMESLSHECITITDAEVALFTPYSISILKKLDIDRDIIELISMGLELEDYESLIPHKLNEIIDEIKELAIKKLKQMKNKESQMISREKWIDN
ncbi:putative histidine transporter YuiF (NhaC family) [Breznakia sp. PF5-3]|uniref:DUF3969 family protein n=1 Tax=unclassified Breznakia TaxID=2623764 RepID=UPI002404D8EA|nr:MULTISPECIES: DUF3969 family protein [unclassified Breznakia]MDF9825366.1 putative histidine transporter YuiF (NhaC family) [Breznakia sp. PM6-1]MDF9836244.1 putative histidine transporter YuiF (NhaC family) [Breznakia sp. PF5-3]MDF9838516.1 putative histidine transporter YuiF (NhaC family) [Breznakia sp. PFB2-8]MDF9860489.1 putative histidine transporter YuiF (NhaC family) [Breznakia sp. PH5-24]